jgi:S-adenosylmethionine:tRNA ribosyltransferase-isomerase
MDRASGAIQHDTFSSLPAMLREGDLLVVNRSRVLPARLLGQLTTGGQAEILYMFPEPGDSDHFRALVRPGRRLKIGAVVHLAPDETCRVTAIHADGSRTVRHEGRTSILDLMRGIGHLPLPPYIDRADTPLDHERYQTIYAKDAGSIAAPTAGLHFTDALLRKLEARGVLVHEITLHVGPGTFARVDAEEIEDHVVQKERFFVPDATAQAFVQARARGSRVIGVGTTTVRTLETVWAAGGLRTGPGETDLVIRPGHSFRAVDAMITNFHLPKSSLLFLVSAFAGRESILAAYRAAIAQNYRFYSYGDAMLIH